MGDISDYRLSVVLTVGPDEHHRRWLQEALDSIAAQSRLPDEVVMVVDGPEPTNLNFPIEATRLWFPPWRCGPNQAVNFGVGLAAHPLVLLMASDDKLQPWCVRDCLLEWDQHQNPMGYYWLDIEYSTGEKQGLASGAAMVPKHLWEVSGGYPVEAIAAADHLYVSMIMSAKGKGGTFYHVGSQAPPYWYRVHPNTLTSTHTAQLGSIIGPLRDYLNAKYAARWGVT